VVELVGLWIRTALVYNFQLEGDHCYRVEQQGLLVHHMSLPQGMVQTSNPNNKNHFRAEEGGNPDFFIDGSLKAGTVSFMVIAEINGKRGVFKGYEFFDAMLDYFGIQRVKKISAQWSDARREYRTNLDIFNNETKGGATKDIAAFATHTGRWSRNRGFTIILSIDTTPDDFPGGYEQVLVEFGKPPVVPKKVKQK
jgi:hypothetical protein